MRSETFNKVSTDQEARDCSILYHSVNGLELLSCDGGEEQRVLPTVNVAFFIVSSTVLTYYYCPALHLACFRFPALCLIPRKRASRTSIEVVGSNFRQVYAPVCDLGFERRQCNDSNAHYQGAWTIFLSTFQIAGVALTRKLDLKKGSWGHLSRINCKLWCSTKI